MLKLRPYQDRAVGGVGAEFARGKRKVLLVSPTGSGKTVMFSDIARKTSQRGRKVLVLAHRIELLEQCGDKMRLNEVGFAYVNPKYTPNPHSRVQVGTMQTVVNRLERMNFYPDLIIVDECHRILSKTYQAILKHYEKAYVLGVTATPIRGDGRSLGEFFQSMVLGPSVEELIGLGALVQPKTFAPLEHLDLSDVDITSEGEFNSVQLEKKVNKPGVTGSAVEHYRKLAHGMPAVAFCVSIKHAIDVAAEFRAAGYLFEHIDGNMPDHDVYDAQGQRISRGRKDILSDLKSGRIQGITSVDLVAEGFDAPMLICAIMLRPTNSLGQWIQMAGRILRPSDGKAFGIILDHAGGTLRFGLVTDPQEWSLEVTETKKKRKRRRTSEKSTPIAQCAKCHCMHKPAPKCPQCGNPYAIAGSVPKHSEGELTEVTGAAALVLRMQKSREVTDCNTLEELQKLGERRCYEPGWASAVWARRNKKLNMV